MDGYDTTLTRTAYESGKRAATKAQNRAIILAAAHDVFTDLGYETTTVRDIIRRTPFASGTFYNYFPDKESVFRAVVEESMRKALERLRHGRRTARTFEEFVTSAYQTYFRYIAEDRATFDLMRRNADAIRTLKEIPEFNAGPYEVLEDTRDAIARGLIGNVDAEYLATAMAAVAIELGILMAKRDPIDVEFATRFASTIFLTSIEKLSGIRPTVALDQPTDGDLDGQGARP
jgi:AcrR family transcriptional regulator